MNNAGVLRDRMIFNMTEDEFDLVMRVHCKGHFAMTRHACARWREAAKATGNVYGRIINTASEAGLMGTAGNSNYAMAKAAIAALTISIAREMGRYGVTSNFIAPRARTRMTESMPNSSMFDKPESGFDAFHPAWPAQLVVLLASEAAATSTARASSSGAATWRWCAAGTSSARSRRTTRRSARRTSSRARPSSSPTTRASPCSCRTPRCRAPAGRLVPPGTVQPAPLAVHVRDLRKPFPRATALDGVSFVVRPGEVVGLLGANGAGKTTTLHILLGLIRPTAGSVALFGADPHARGKAALRRVGFASPEALMDWRLTVEENLRVYAGLLRPGARRRGGYDRALRAGAAGAPALR